MTAAIAVQDTTVAAYHAQGHKARMNQAEQVLAVMRAAYRTEGIVNLTTTEITQRLQAAYPASGWHPGKTSARINALTVKDGPLVWCETTRLCTVSNSGRQCRPVMLRQVQGRLVA